MSFETIAIISDQLLKENIDVWSQQNKESSNLNINNETAYYHVLRGACIKNN